VNNVAIAAAFTDIARFLQLKNDSIFKIRAYQRAADIIQGLDFDLNEVRTRPELLAGIPGIGDAISAKITELVETGRLEYLEKLKSEFPPALLPVLDVTGIGPKTAMMVVTELGLKTVDDLEKAIASGALAALPRIGERNAERILRHFKALAEPKRRTIGEALPAAEGVMRALSAACPDVRKLTVAGALRRWQETIGDIDLVCVADDPAAVTRAFSKLPIVTEILGQGDTQASVIVAPGFQVDLRVVADAHFASLLLYFTGSQQHTAQLRTAAQKLGLSLNEYGLTDQSGKLHEFESEAALYEHLGFAYVEPELREGQDELAAATSGSLPALISLSDIRGDLHTHSNWTDGDSTIDVMVAEAEKRGIEYIAITDHSVSRAISNGLSVDRLRLHRAQIESIRLKKPGIKVLCGSEIDILADGSLDYSDEVLAGLDVVAASVHSAMGQKLEIMTERIIRAMRNPHVTVVGHLTTRMLPHRGRPEGREPIEADLDALFRAAADTGTLLEINASPSRLDLKDTHVRRASQLGARFVISTDAHSTAGLDDMKYGVGTARRGWCAPSLVMNTLAADEFTDFLKTPKPERGKWKPGRGRSDNRRG